MAENCRHITDTKKTNLECPLALTIKILIYLEKLGGDRGLEPRTR